MSKILSKKILKYCYYIILAVIILYGLLFMCFFYIGPVTTYKVKNALKKHPQNIIVSLTTTPHRINTIKPVLESISRQTVKPNKIYVNVPWRFKRDNSEYKIPKWLKTYPGIVINRTKDYGPATKLVATLEKEKDPETIIITIDDDTIYTKHVVRDLVKQYLFADKAKNSAITGLGLNLLFFVDHDLYYKRITCPNCDSLILVGISAVAYKRFFFKEDIFSFWDRIPLNCAISDDLMLSAYLLHNGIKIIKASGFVFNPVALLLFGQLSTSFDNNALQKGAGGLLGTGSNETNYISCVGELLQSVDNKVYANILLKNSKSFLLYTYKQLIYETFYSIYVNYLHGLLNMFPFVSTLFIKTLV